MWRCVLLSIVLISSACEGPMGPQGPRGPQGPTGSQGPSGVDLSVQVETATILNRNYTEGNSNFASIPLGDSFGEPTVLFLGIENENGVYSRIEFSGIIWGGSDSDYSVPGTSGWYVLVFDRDKDLVGSNYQVKFVQ